MTEESQVTPEHSTDAIGAVKSLATDNIYSRIASCVIESGAITKSGHFKQGQQNWHFHQIDEIVDHLRQILVSNGVMYIPSIQKSTHSTIITTEHDRERVQRCCEVELDVYFVNIDNPSDQFVMSSVGDGLDYGDKAPGKAFSYALKTALLAVFQLRGQPDNETDGVEAAAPSKQKPAGKAPSNNPVPWERPDLSDIEATIEAWETIPCHISKEQFKPLLGDLKPEHLRHACFKWSLPDNPTDQDKRLRAALNLAKKEKFPNG